jgi:hypothetical protein
VWRDILQTSGALPEELRSFITRMRRTLDAIEAGDVTGLEGLFDRANRAAAGDKDE